MVGHPIKKHAGANNQSHQTYNNILTGLLACFTYHVQQALKSNKKGVECTSLCALRQAANRINPLQPKLRLGFKLKKHIKKHQHCGQHQTSISHTTKKQNHTVISKYMLTKDSFKAFSCINFNIT